MHGWLVAEFGGPDVMRWVELPDPVPGPGQLRVKVHASGINFAETRMRAGTYSGQQLPFVMGMESAGVVEAIGPGVTTVKAGDRVFGRARGSHATHVLFDEVHTLPLPESLSFVEGAAIPVGWLTAWHALVTVARARAGERVLIEAIASSVGSAALQIARWQGCWVAGTASRDDKCARAVAAGAAAAYNYKTMNQHGRTSGVLQPQHRHPQPAIARHEYFDERTLRSRVDAQLPSDRRGVIRQGRLQGRRRHHTADVGVGASPRDGGFAHPLRQGRAGQLKPITTLPSRSLPVRAACAQASTTRSSG